MKAAIIGASGLVGGHLLSQLLEDSDFSEVISVGRSELSLKNSKLRQVKIRDLTELNSVSDQIIADHYYCCLGTTLKKAGNKANFLKVDHKAVLDFSEIAKKHHSKSFSVISAKGADASSLFFYNQTKGKVEQDLQQLGLSKLLIFRPALLEGSRNESRVAEGLALKVASFIPDKFKNSFLTNARYLAMKMLLESKEFKEQLGVFETKDLR